MTTVGSGSPDDELDKPDLAASQGDVPLDRAALPEATNPAPAAPKHRKDEASASEAETANKLRLIAFVVILALLTISGLSTTVMMWFYLTAVDYRPDRVTMTAWISASIVQLGGLTYVIMRYLSHLSTGSEPRRCRTRRSSSSEVSRGPCETADSYGSKSSTSMARTAAAAAVTAATRSSAITDDSNRTTAVPDPICSSSSSSAV